MIGRHLLAALFLLTSGCDVLGPQDYTCDPFPPSPALLVSVLDSISGELLLASQVTVTVTDGAFSEIKGGGNREGPAQFWMAMERPGIYRVDAHADGYQDWTSPGFISVTSDECGIQSRGVNIRLQEARVDAP